MKTGFRRYHFANEISKNKNLVSFITGEIFYIKDFTLGILYNIIHEEEFMAVRKKYESV